MEIFQDGELEEEMRKRDYQVHNLSAIWQLFSSSYQEAIKSLTCPLRATYSIHELGPSQFTLDASTIVAHSILPPPIGDQQADDSIQILREDLQLVNPRGEVLECSFWHRQLPTSASLSSSSIFGKHSSSSPAPCIVYLHGMSSSRKECVYLRDKVLGSGFSLLALDFSGSGLSEGDHMSFGHFEKDDLRTVLDFLFATNRASRVGIWGRCIGGAAALLNLCDSLDSRYKKLRLSKRDAKKLLIGQCKHTGTLLCVRPGRVFSFRVSPFSISNGDFAILSIGNLMVKGLDVESCRQLLDDCCSFSMDGCVEICGYERRTGSAVTMTATANAMVTSPVLSTRTTSSLLQDDPLPFVFALALDSTYGDMECVISDMLAEIGKSAEKRNVSFPSAMVAAASKILSRSVRKTAGFQFSDIAVLDSVHALRQLPCQFVSVSRVDFIRPEHLRAIYDVYGGEKSWLAFEGVHDQNRPEIVLDHLCRHFVSQWHHESRVPITIARRSSA